MTFHGSEVGSKLKISFLSLWNQTLYHTTYSSWCILIWNEQKTHWFFHKTFWGIWKLMGLNFCGLVFLSCTMLLTCFPKTGGNESHTTHAHNIDLQIKITICMGTEFLSMRKSISTQILLSKYCQNKQNNTLNETSNRPPPMAINLYLT